MRRIVRVLTPCLACVILIGLAGCARFPDGGGGNTAPARTLQSEATLAGTVNPNNFYFLAIDTDGDPANGPVPVVTGDGWGVVSPTPPADPVREPGFYVMYHNGQFQQFRNGTPLGPPYRGEVSQDRKRLLIEIDQALLVDTGLAIPDTVQLNWITQEILTDPLGGVKQYDGIGFDGREYLAQLPLNVTQTLTSGTTAPLELMYPERYPDNTVENTTNIADIDLAGYTVETRIRQ